MKNLILPIIIALISVAVITFVTFSISPDYEEEKCPFCYGNEFCLYKNTKHFSLRMYSISDIINNLFSVKNIYFTTDNLVLKKLGHTEDLNSIDNQICKLHNKFSHENCQLGDYSVDIQVENNFDYDILLKTSLATSGRGYKLCGANSNDIFLSKLKKSEGDFNTINLWTISLINFEPLFYKAFNQEAFNLPKYYGACGRVIAVENAGISLNAYENHDWFTRASIARSIISLFSKFTDGDDDFRIYLTDISPDNIVVDEVSLQAKFVDFGNVILVQKSSSPEGLKHQSENIADFDGDGFSFSESDICSSSISDHNIYSICKLILSNNAPWPMMTGGLLHSIPREISTSSSEIFELIESCVRPKGNFDSNVRFKLIYKLDHVLEGVLSQNI